MTDETDSRTAALRMQLLNPEQLALVTHMLRRFEELEQLEFGEIEPVGIAAPRASR